MGLAEFENRLKEALRGVEEIARSAVDKMVRGGRDTRTCPKCGCGAVMLQYHGGKEECQGLLGHYRATAFGEHLHCRCSACEYDWAEPVLGTTPENRKDGKSADQNQSSGRSEDTCCQTHDE